MDIALKQRLVGATVLIALAVIILPMLLGGRPEDGRGPMQRIEIPEQPPELNYETRRFPVGAEESQKRPAVANQPIELPSPSRQDALEPPAPSADAGRESGPSADTDLPDPALTDMTDDEASDLPPPGTERIAEAQEPPVSVVEPEPAVVARSSASGRYAVQVASFRSSDNATRLAGQLQARGYGVLADTVSSEVGTLHRVRVGPFESEAEADSAISALKEQVKDVTPRVVDLEPGRSSQVTQPSDPLVRWVVQVGSFSSATNADNLVAKLRLEGQSAYKESVSGSGGTIYRVRVGPFIERDEAIRVDGLINDRLSIDGVVMSAD